MTTAYAVVGANYGDEGKGLLTDSLSFYLPDAIIVRYSGGAQAGHTVVTPKGERHVFSHLGAGSFIGNQTYLSRFFVVNPMIFEKEHKDFCTKKAPKPRVEVDTYCSVSTPWDIILNRASKKGFSTCGVGINETITRVERGVQSTFDSVIDFKLIEEYFWNRLDELGIKILPEPYKSIVDSSDLKEVFKKSMEYTLNHTKTCNGIPKNKDIIFEGSQGLLLDPEYGTFPYVTRTSVGVKNAIKLAKEAGVDIFHAIYVTRCYLTRHGDGPLPNEMEKRPDVEEKTNLFNKWQGKFRYAPLDLKTLKSRVQKDAINLIWYNIVPPNPLPFQTNVSIALTCIDHHNKFYRNNWSNLVTELEDIFGPSMILSAGQTREDINYDHFEWTK